VIEIDEERKCNLSKAFGKYDRRLCSNASKENDDDKYLK